MGALSLNGRPLTRALHTRACIYVPREDILWPSLTPRQHMSFAFRLYTSPRSMPPRERRRSTTCSPPRA
jgi:ABC-type multidrug transport system ATPase subunit